jgi:DNA repair protein RadC
VFNFSDLILTVPSGEPLPPAEEEVLITRIREHVKSNGIRLADHFKDSDPLRANSITNYRFRQVN